MCPLLTFIIDQFAQHRHPTVVCKQMVKGLGTYSSHPASLIDEVSNRRALVEGFKQIESIIYL